MESMKNYKISVIVPVYNLEKFIQESIENLIESNTNIFEIVIIDDGSKDNTPVILTQLANKYPNIKYIDKENGGVADARNVGILNASGSHIAFLDGDDFFQKGAIDCIIDELNDNPEILTYNFADYYDDNNIIYHEHFNPNAITKNGKITANTFAQVSPLPMPWLYVLNKKFVIDNELFMTKGLLDEDEEWTGRLFAKASYCKKIDKTLYYYRRNVENSLTYNRTINNYKADIKIIELLSKETKLNKYSNIQKHILINKIIQIETNLMDEYIIYKDSLTKEEKQKVIKFRRYFLWGNIYTKYLFFISPLIGWDNAKSLRMKISAKLRRKKCF